MEKVDRVTMLVAARIQAGDLERTFWSDIIYTAIKMEAIIEEAIKKKLGRQEIRILAKD